MRSKLFPGFVLLMLLFAATSHASALQWSGYDWTVRADPGGPGPNAWREANVTVDKDDRLHLKISHGNGQWTCSEIFMNKPLGFGTYQFQVSGPIDQLDKNVVLGLFNYPGEDVGPDGTNEIDIEFGRWGKQKNPNGNFTVYPTDVKKDNANSVYEFKLKSLDTTQRFRWMPGKVSFQSLEGFTDGDAGEISSWSTPETFSPLVGKQPVPVHLNLWLFKGSAPSDGKEVEIIIKSFKFTPLQTAGVDDVQIAGADGTTRAWSVAKLKSTFADSIKLIEYESKGQKYHANAIPLIDLVKSAGVDTALKMDPKVDPKTKNYLLRLAVIVQGSDGYTATFSVGELLPDIGNREAWITIDEDGKPLSDKFGPTRIIVPGDDKPARWVRKVTAIRVVDPVNAKP